MRRLIASLAAVPVAAVLFAAPSTAGPDKIAFPAKYKEHVLYTTVDRHDTKQYRELWGTADAVAATAPTPAAAVVQIQDFKFGPAKLIVDKGMSILWTNGDDSPHQVTVTTGAVTRSAVLPKGARHTQSFATPGVYDYMCGLHPGMKGQIEVK